MRIRTLNQKPIKAKGEYVLYWMVATRRPYWNFALDRAVFWAQELSLPLVVYEPLRINYPWANLRFHQFIIDGMRANELAFEKENITYIPFVETKQGEGARFLDFLLKNAAIAVTDDFPCFFLPNLIQKKADQADLLFEAVDSNGLLPIRLSTQPFPTAYAFRRHLQRELRKFLFERPQENSMKNLPKRVLKLAPELLKAKSNLEILDPLKLSIDQAVYSIEMKGGYPTAHRRFTYFLNQGLSNYAVKRNEPEEDGTSGLSGYLHFGHISVHEMVSEILKRESWSPDQIGKKNDGKKEGWWGLSPSTEAFLDELITWRELGFHFSTHVSNYDRFESLPPWALATLKKHENDDRHYSYSQEVFENGKTHDDLWNAAQMQLKSEGRIHNYLRMLWGKKIIEWSPTPKNALETMIHLNNKYAVDGRDPNSYSGIFWCLGRFDRPWGPERAIFGTVRYMSSDNTKRKLQVKNYVRRYLTI